MLKNVLSPIVFTVLIVFVSLMTQSCAPSSGSGEVDNETAQEAAELVFMAVQGIVDAIIVEGTPLADVYPAGMEVCRSPSTQPQ